MNSQKETLLNNRSYAHSPFPHFSTDQVLDNELATNLLSWLKRCDHWQFTKTSFYTQYEFSLLEMVVPDPLLSLSSQWFIDQMAHVFKNTFNEIGRAHV